MKVKHLIDTLLGQHRCLRRFNDTHKFKSIIGCIAPKLWSKIPIDVKMFTSLNSFKNTYDA